MHASRSDYLVQGKMTLRPLSACLYPTQELYLPFELSPADAQLSKPEIQLDNIIAVYDSITHYLCTRKM